MKKNKIFGTKRIYLRPVSVKDANQNYCRWMNDPEVTRYTESRFLHPNLNDIKAYIRKELKSKNTVFLAIIFRANGKHIGNIKIHRIEQNHRHAEASLLIGEKSYWGMGIGAEAIKLIVKYGFTILKLHKLYAECYDNNEGSIKAFKKAGFKEEGRLKKHYIFDGRYIGSVFLGILNPDFNPNFVLRKGYRRNNQNKKVQAG